MSFVGDLVFEGTVMPLTTTELTRRAPYDFRPTALCCKEGGELELEGLSFAGKEQLAVSAVPLQYFAPQMFGVSLVLPSLRRDSLVTMRLKSHSTEPVRFRVELGRHT